MDFWVALVLVLMMTFIMFASLREKSNTILVVLGSGGHTTEMLKLLKNINFQQYKFLYLMADSDTSSEAHLQKFDPSYTLLRIPRSRNVGQSWLTTPFTTLYSACYSVYILFRYDPALLVCNGPGTCVPISVLAFMFRMFLLCSTRIIFIESFARVRSLSLSGKILYFIANR